MFTIGDWMPQFPDHRGHKRCAGDDRERENQIRAEPIHFLSFVQDDFQRGQAEGDQSQPDQIDAEGLPSSGGALGEHVRGISQDNLRQHQRNNPYGKVNIKNPSPGITVGDPPAEGRTQNRRHQYGEGIDGHGHSPLGGGKRIEQNRLNRRLKSATPSPEERERKSALASWLPFRTGPNSG